LLSFFNLRLYTEADRKLSGKDAEIKLLLGNLKQLTDGLGQGG
jgi:hypothetical protein